MTALKIGSLCSGYGGLDLAIEQFFGAETAWFSEFEAAPSKVLAHHWPGVPNLGDMTTIDWASVEPVDIIAGGTPCQDLSAAGRRRGMTEGTRSNLWVQMREAIAIIRPSIVIWENVRGAYSARAASDVEHEKGLLGKSTGGPALRALGRVLGDLSDLGFDAEVVGLRAADAGAPHARFRVFVVAYSDGVGREWGRGTRDGWFRPEDSGRNPSDALSLLPTPAAVNPNDGEAFETWEARRQSIIAKGINGNGMGMPLSIATQLLPTPTTAIATGGNAVRGGTRSDEKLLPGIVQDELAKPSPTKSIAEYEALWAALDDQSPFWRTPDGKDYWPAIERWTHAIGRAAPSPTLPDGKGGRHRLNAKLAEWMMGQQFGWVTAPVIGLTRNEQLKALGNGVVTQQAQLAFTIAWSRVLEQVAA